MVKQLLQIHPDSDKFALCWKVYLLQHIVCLWHMICELFVAILLCFVYRCVRKCSFHCRKPLRTVEDLSVWVANDARRHGFSINLSHTPLLFRIMYLDTITTSRFVRPVWHTLSTGSDEVKFTFEWNRYNRSNVCHLAWWHLRRSLSQKGKKWHNYLDQSPIEPSLPRQRDIYCKRYPPM